MASYGSYAEKEVYDDVMMMMWIPFMVLAVTPMET